jgi:ADP-ribose pyrophosphatase
MNPNQNPEIRTLSSRVVYQNRWMNVREDAIERSDGQPGLYGVVEKADFAVIVPWDRGGLHLVQQYRYPVGARYWELPQGSWEASEVSPLDLARAELQEETGLTASSMELLGYLYLGYGYSTQGYHIYLAGDLKAGPPRPDPEEQGLESRWFSWDAVEALVLDGSIRDATTVAALGLWRMKAGLV